MVLVSRVGAPLVWLLEASTRRTFQLLGRSAEADGAITEEEITAILAQAATAGVIEADEKRLISGVLRLGDRAARGIMTPRADVDQVDLEDNDADIRLRLVTTPHSRLPVVEGDPDNVIGIIKVRDLLKPALAGEPIDVRAHLRQAPMVPDTLDALNVLQILRAAEVPVALVHDEYGHFKGIVTPADILDAIAGAFRSDEGASEPEAVQRQDGSWLLAGWMPADEMAKLLGLRLPEHRDYETVAGLIIGVLHHLPQVGESAETLGWRFEVVDFDGRRIDKVLAAPSTSGDPDT
jgi:putative hemolysin